MNTPAHVIISLSLLGKQNALRYPLAIALGALLPDFGMIVFYGYEKLTGVPENIIWNEHYYHPQWQGMFDAANSFVLLLPAMGISWYLGRRWMAVFFGSMIVHCLFDMPVHNDDGHRHFFPLSDFRFHSPLSYWDPAHYGWLVGMVEIALVVAGSLYLYRLSAAPAGKHTRPRMLRMLVFGTVLVYLLFFLFVVRMWVSM